MLSRPVSSGWNPVPTSSNDPTRPCNSAQPRVGLVMRDSTLSSVLLPAPLLPMMPTTSPGSTLKETSSSAHTRSISRATVRPLTNARRRPAPRATETTSDSRSDSYGNADSVRSPMRYCFASPSTRIAQPQPGASNDIGEAVFHPAEIHEAGDEQHDRGSRRRQQEGR